MSWDALIFGELELAAPKQKKWLEARAVVAKARWPQILAPDEDQVGSDRGRVRELIEELRALGGGPTFFQLETRGPTVVIQALLPEDTYREVQNHLVGVLSAASKCGATGTVDVRNAGTLTGWRSTRKGSRGATSRPSRAPRIVVAPALCSSASPHFNRPRRRCPPTLQHRIPMSATACRSR